MITPASVTKWSTVADSLAVDLGRAPLVKRALDLVDPYLYDFFFGDLKHSGFVPPSYALVKEKARGNDPNDPKNFRSPVFFNGDTFLENFDSAHLCWIGGRLGTGKTALGVALARHLYDKGMVDGVFTNMPIDSRYIPVIDRCNRAAILLDEGNLFASARNSQWKDVGYGAFARKIESWWISASKNAVDKQMRDVVARRKADLWLFGVWLYGWGDGENDEGWFVWRNYKCVFGRYKTDWIPLDDGGILDELKNEIARRGGSTRHLLLPGSDHFKVSLSGSTN